MRLLLGIVMVLSSSPAWASYNINCMKLLMSPRRPAVDRFYETMQAEVHRHFPTSLRPRDLGPVDYEAIHDVVHNMPLIAVFGDGSRMKFSHTRDSLEKLVTKMKTLNVIQVLYQPPALDRIRMVLREACKSMGQRGCDTYDDYIGLMDNRIRTFTRAEEQVIKWATVYQLPTNYTVDAIREKSENTDDMNRRIEESRVKRLRLSQELLRGIFNEAKADQIFWFARGYINDGFDRIKNIANSNVIVIKR